MGGPTWNFGGGLTYPCHGTGWSYSGCSVTTNSPAFFWERQQSQQWAFWRYALHETQSQLDVNSTSNNEMDGAKNYKNVPAKFMCLWSILITFVKSVVNLWLPSHVLFILYSVFDGTVLLQWCCSATTEFVQCLVWFDPVCVVFRLCYL